MKLKLATIAAASALAFNAHAIIITSTTDWGAHDPIVEYASPPPRIGSFGDAYLFTLPDAIDLFSTAVSNNISGALVLANGHVDLFADGPTTDTLINGFDFGGTTGDTPFSFGALAGGAYFYLVSGDGIGTAGGFYNLTSNVTPVPEPQTYALMLAGLGVVGFLARRRRPQA